MNVLKFLICSLVCFFGMPLTSSTLADIVTIDLTSTDGGTGQVIDAANPLVSASPSFTVVESAVPLTVTLAGTGTGPGAFFNGTSGSFGINSDGADETARIENALGETISFSFSIDVGLHNADFDNLNNDEVVTVTVGASSFTIADGLSGDIFDFGDIPVSAGTPITFSVSSLEPNNGVGFDAISVHVEPVPEPGSLALLGFGSVLMIARRRRRKQKSSSWLV